MTPERWQQIEEVFQAVIDLAPEKRAAYLNAKYSADAELIEEIEKLIADYEDAGDFIESPVWTDSFMLSKTARGEIGEAINKEIRRDDGSLIGQRFGVYRLTKELGRGGMGAVYLAERDDGEFRQRVALKVIKRGMDTDFIVRRFRNERQILATLDHPNIGRLLDGGTTDDGLPFFVMEYIDGRPVYRYCDDEKLGINERLQLFRQICFAVDYAHQNLIIHRDIKPSNILVTADGTPKLLDFGIAKILNPELAADSIDPTATAMRMMTPEYASPEQVRGEPVTKASDIYSLGVLLYELLTGHRPYRLKNRALHEIARVICEEEPEGLSASLTREDNLVPTGGPDKKESSEFVFENRRADLETLRREFSGDLEKIVLKALRKNPRERYRSSAELAEDILHYLENRPILAEDFYASSLKTSKPVALRVSDQISVAVLPLKLLGTATSEDTGDEYLCIGLADALITRLSNVRRLIVRPTGSVLKYGGSEIEPLASGAELGVDFVIDGSIRRIGRKLRVSVQLLNVREGATRWADNFDEDFTDVLSLEDLISEKIAEVILPQITGDERARLKKRGTNSPEAYEAFLKGRFFWNLQTEEGFARSLVYYRQAVELDPRYALAFAAMAEYYIFIGIHCVIPFMEGASAAKEAAEKAIEIDSTLAEGYAALGFVAISFDLDWRKAEKLFLRGIELNPHSITTQFWYTALLAQSKRFDESFEQLERIKELDPQSLLGTHMTAWVLYHARRYEESLEMHRQMLQNEPTYAWGFKTYSWALRRVGRFDEALENAQKAVSLTGPNPMYLTSLAAAYAEAGNRARAEEILAELAQIAKTRFVSEYMLALVHCALGDKEKAFEYLEISLETRDGWMNWFGVEPQFDLLRDDPRYADLLRRSGNFLGKDLDVFDRRDSIAVLPFKLLGTPTRGETGDEYLGIGLADALVTRLSNLRRLVVRPTSSVLHFDKTEFDSFAAGRKLGVGFILEGKIRRAGERLRVTVQLLDVTQSAVRWAESFDERFTDVLDIEDSISEKVVKSLIPKLTGDEERQLKRRGTNSHEAYEEYLKGRYYWNQFTPDSLLKAKDAFLRAIALDEKYALAYVGLADFYIWGNIYGMMPSAEALALAETSARKAIEFDDKLGEAYASLGLINQNRKNWTEAESLQNKAIALNPNYVHAHEWYAAQLIGLGRTDEGVRKIETAEKLDLLSRRTKTLTAWTLYQAHRFEDALRRAREILDLDENYPQGYLQVGINLLALGRKEEALPYFEKFDKLLPDSALTKYPLCFALVANGRTAEARKTLEEIKTLTSKTYVKPYFVGMAYTALGEFDEAFACFEKSFFEDDPWMVWFGTEPQLESLRDDERYQNLLRRMNNPLAKMPETASLAVNQTSDKKSIAVLPLKILHAAQRGETEEEFLGIGLTDALINRLSSVRRFIVRPTSSVIRFRGAGDPFIAAEDLNVEYIVDGSVRRVGERIRVSIQLLEAQQKTAVWAKSFDENLTDVLTLEDLVSEQIAEALVVKLTGEERERIVKRKAPKPEAYEAYLRGRFHWHSYTAEGLAKSLVCFYEAIAADPNFAPAYSGVADYYNFLSIFGIMAPNETFPAAKESALKAVELDKNLAEAYISLAVIALGFDWDFAKAENYLKKALELNPNSAEAHNWLGQLLSLQGKHARAVREMEKAERLNPQSASLCVAFAIVLRNAQRFEEGLAKLRQAIALHPQNPTALAGFNWFVKHLGNFEEAEESCRRAVELSDRQSLPLYAYAYTLACAGKRDAARQLAEELETRRAKQYVPPIFSALIEIELGEPETAFKWLGKAFDERDFWAIYVPVDVRFDALKDDPRYEYLVGKIKPQTAEPEDEDIHQSHVATKIFAPAEVTAETVENNVAEEKPTEPRRRKRWLYAGIGASLLGILGIVTFQGVQKTENGYEIRFGQKPSNSAPNLNSTSSKTIAVLPFETDGNVENEESFGVGLAESVVGKLRQVKEVSVGLVFLKLKNAPQIEELANNYKAGYVLRGKLQIEGQRVKVDAELVNTADGKVLWLEKFDEDLKDFQNLQTAISERVLKALTIELSVTERRQISKKYTENSEAYQTYLVGRYQLSKRNAENLQNAVKTFEKTRRLDPQFALAYVGLADAYTLLNLYQIPPPPNARELAKENALKALELDAELAEAHASLGYILFFHERRREEAVRELNRAIELNPSYPTAYHWLALILSAMGRHDEAVLNIKKAVELEPRSAIIQTAAGSVYLYARNYDEALKTAEKVLEVNEGFVPVYKTQRAVHQATGNYGATLAAYKNERIYSENTDENDEGWMMIAGQVEAVGGLRDEALTSLKRAGGNEFVKKNPALFAYEIALGYALLNETDSALEWLKKAKDANAYGFNFAEVDPRLDKIRNDARFAELLKN